MIEVDIDSSKPIPKTKRKKSRKVSNPRGKNSFSLRKEKGSVRLFKVFSTFFVILAVFLFVVFLLDRYGNNVFSICKDGDCSSGEGSTKGFISGLVTENPELQQVNGKTSFLVVGLDARSATKEGNSYKGDMMNTDTLIQIIFDHEKDNIVMVSIPRDLYIQNKEVPYNGKINGLYYTAEQKYGPGEGIDYLEGQIEQMTGVKIQYYAIVTFDIVKDLIETFGDEVNGEKGLYIDVPKSFNELFPTRSGYISIHFDAGHQFMNTDRLLQYSRARQLTSDWDRARRQQQVIDALKDKMIEGGNLLDFKTLYNTYNTIKKNVVMSPIGTEDLKAALELKDKVGMDYTSVILNPKFGGMNKLITTYPAANFDGASLQGPVGYDYSYSNVADYLGKVLNYPKVYDEDAKVVVYNYTGEYELKDEKIDKLTEEYPIDVTIKNYARKEMENYKIYDFSNGEVDATLNEAENVLGVVESPVLNPDTGVKNFSPIYGEDISILVGARPPQEATVAN